MNFRTSYLAGILASLMAVATVPLFSEVKAAEPLKITGPDGQSREANQRQYGPTTPQDTFWSIAQKVRPDSSVSVYQVMAALYDANPHAFSGANYNTLEKGMILLIPSKEVMQAIPATLAQQRAQAQDKAWRTGKVEARPVTAPVEKPTEVKPAPATIEPPKVEPAPVVVPQVTPQLVEENQALSAEITRLTEALGVRNNDVEALTAQVSQLTEEIQALKETALQLEVQNEQLRIENKGLNQAKALAEVEANKPDDIWRSLMDNPILLIIGGVIPALFVLLLVWMFLRRRNKGDSDTAPTAALATAAAATAATAAVVAAEPDEDEMAVHLDSGDEEESLDALLDMDNVDLKPETMPEGEDLVVEMAEKDDFADDGQSLDDLWAEAMGEQTDLEDVSMAGPDELLAEFDIAAEPDAEDLDALMSELDADIAAPMSTASKQDDAGESVSADVSDDELDSLMAGLNDADEDGKQLGLAADPDAIAEELEAQLSAEMASTGDTIEDDLDSLLADFGSPVESGSDDEDLSGAIAAELDTELGMNEPSTSDEDIDSLLADFDSPVERSSDDQDLSGAIAAELDAELGIDEPSSSDEDIDALLAEFDEPAAVTKVTVEDDLSAEIAAELETAISPDATNGQTDDTDLDGLLASFDAGDSETLSEADNIAAGLGNELPISDSDDDLDSLLAGFDEDLGAGSDGAEVVQESVDGAVVADVTEVTAQSAPDKPLEFTKASDADPVAVSARDSGFFDDLKANKGANVLEWEPSPSKSTEDTVDISDDDLLAAFAEQDDDDFILNVDEEHSMTVDEALAALDASEKSKRQTKIDMDEDLTSFQKENGFIDIDKLLNDADDGGEAEPYRELDMDIGEVDNLIGDAAMVDVDDEENSVNAKLDLARAYIEIDDRDSARALLKEVELDGNDRQKSEALTLLSEIG
ncbi:FimV/HubP family polar landmark protein [Shewanella sp.]|uniref:FimV/HubP family polar landmark protein n=1 Tax=Shewanella sp. TaxID=50422 RepID=UPI003564F9D3